VVGRSVRGRPIWAYSSGATVRTHFEHIYAKLRVRDRPGAVAKAMRLGLIA
jgi:ATP/maltotriose-dependent transcriptional regulator MalT